MLIVKTLRQLNLFLDDSAGGELNIIFDNCSGQNKNNTVLKLAAWLKAMGFFCTMNFTFLVVGHTKNAADRLFNSLKHKYRKRNIHDGRLGVSIECILIGNGDSNIA